MADLDDLLYELALAPRDERLTLLDQLLALFPEHHDELVAFLIELALDELANPPEEPSTS